MTDGIIVLCPFPCTCSPAFSFVRRCTLRGFKSILILAGLSRDSLTLVCRIGDISCVCCVVCYLYRLLSVRPQVKKAIAPFYKTILCIFKHYCLTPSSSVRGAFSIQPNQFGKMMQDADFAGNFISVEEIGKIFVMVNFETDKASQKTEKR